MLHQIRQKVHNVQAFNFQQGRYKKFSQKSIPLQNSREIKIPVPWGHVAGKLWGSPDVQPVLAFHGVQDNAATFDKLAPLLHVDALLAIDIPGHGWSSHIPPGIPYDVSDAVCLLRYLVKDYFKWTEPAVLLGHSFGSSLFYIYSAAFPDQVSKYVSIDCARHQMSDLPNTTVETMRNTMEKMLQLEERTKPPEYTYEELLETFYKGRRGLLSKESCEILLSRGMNKLDNGKVYLSRDVRIKLNAFGRSTHDILLDLAPKIKCDVLSIQCDKGTVRNNAKGDIYRKTVDIMLKNSSRSKHVLLSGYHHLHLDNPEPVANEINIFFKS